MGQEAWFAMACVTDHWKMDAWSVDTMCTTARWYVALEESSRIHAARPAPLDRKKLKGAKAVQQVHRGMGEGQPKLSFCSRSPFNTPTTHTHQSRTWWALSGPQVANLNTKPPNQPPTSLK